MKITATVTENHTDRLGNGKTHEFVAGQQVELLADSTGHDLVQIAGTDYFMTSVDGYFAIIPAAKLAF